MEKLDEPARSMRKDHTESEATNKIKDQTNDLYEISKSTPHKDPCNETEKIFDEGQPTWKGEIYARRNHDQVVEDPIPQPNQELNRVKVNRLRQVNLFLVLILYIPTLMFP